MITSIVTFKSNGKLKRFDCGLLSIITKDNCKIRHVWSKTVMLKYKQMSKMEAVLKLKQMLEYWWFVCKTERENIWFDLILNIYFI